MRKWNGMTTEGDHAVSASKIAHHRSATKKLKVIAKDILGLDKSEFTVRVNAGGPGVLGESILHADKIYAMVVGADKVMWRSCRGQKDYTGGTNRFGTWEQFIAHCQNIVKTGIYPVG